MKKVCFFVCVLALMIPSVSFASLRDIFHPVPFTPQAPFGDWDDSRQQEGCEEASMIMAMYWVKDKPLSYTHALQEILSISEFERETLGFFEDTSAQTTVNVMKEYYNYEHIDLLYDVTTQDLIDVLEAGHVIMAPMNGRELHNPYFTPPGPLHHMIVIHGFDADTHEFITHDPGTRKGANYRYSYETVQKALRDYPDGFYADVEIDRTAIIVVKRLPEEVHSVKGKVILQVEDKGQAYYVPPTGTGLFYLGRPSDAFNIMREQGVGISNRDLNRIPIGLNANFGSDTDGDGLTDKLESALQTNPEVADTDGDGFSDKTEVEQGYSPILQDVSFDIDMDFARKQVGKILLQVEQNGEAWYINPDNAHRYYLGTPSDTMQYMRNFGLGVTNAHINTLVSHFQNALDFISEYFDQEA